MSIKNKHKKSAEEKTLDDARRYVRLEKSGWLTKFLAKWNLPEQGFIEQNSYDKWRNEFLVKPTNRFLQSAGKE